MILHLIVMIAKKGGKKEKKKRRKIRRWCVFLTGCLHDALQDNNNLELFVHERALGQVKKGALGIYFMADGERGNQEELVCTRPKTDIQFTLVQRQELALWCLTRLEESQRKKFNTRKTETDRNRKFDAFSMFFC